LQEAIAKISDNLSEGSIPKMSSIGNPGMPVTTNYEGFLARQSTIRPNENALSDSLSQTQPSIVN